MIRGIATSSSPTYDCESNMDNRIKFFLKEHMYFHGIFMKYVLEQQMKDDNFKKYPKNTSS